MATIEEQLAELRALVQPSQQQPATSQITLGGNAYNVRDTGEAQRLFDQYQEQQQNELAALRLRAEAAENAQADRERMAEEAQRRSQPNADQFSKEEYAKLFLDDPRKASKYALQHDTEQQGLFRGIIGEISALKAQLEASNREAAARSFLDQHRDYTPTPENSAKMEKLVQQFNLPWNLDGMTAAFLVGKQQGLFVGDEPVRQASTEDAPRNPAPPRISKRRSNGGEDAEAALLSEFEGLSSDQQRAFIERQYAGR